MVTAAPPSISTAKSVTFNLSTAATDSPVSTVQVEPLSAPPLSRTIPPPSISIVPLDQLSALGTALLSQQRKKQQQLAKQSKALGGTYTSEIYQVVFCSICSTISREGRKSRGRRSRGGQEEQGEGRRSRGRAKGAGGGQEEQGEEGRGSGESERGTGKVKDNC